MRLIHIHGALAANTQKPAANHGEYLSRCGSRRPPAIETIPVNSDIHNYYKLLYIIATTSATDMLAEIGLPVGSVPDYVKPGS
jgi:hypothetical protein